MRECLLYASALYPFVLKLRDNLLSYLALIAVWIPLRMRWQSDLERACVKDLLETHSS